MLVALSLGDGLIIPHERRRDLLVERAGVRGSGRACDHGCLGRQASAGVRTEVAYLHDSITAHLEQSQMFGVRELGRRSSIGADRVVNEYRV